MRGAMIVEEAKEVKDRKVGTALEI